MPGEHGGISKEEGWEDAAIHAAAARSAGRPVTPVADGDPGGDREIQRVARQAGGGGEARARAEAHGRGGQADLEGGGQAGGRRRAVQRDEGGDRRLLSYQGGRL